jgi:HD superfamily phosphohydrolase
MKEITIPVDGVIDVQGVIKQVDNIYFQRLRHVKQLSLAYLVFPSATHTRFEHSLGVYAKAYRVLQNNKIDDPCFLQAALLHDIGHPPYSHLIEVLLPENHEEIGKMIVDKIEVENKEKVKELMTSPLLTSRPFGLDKLDYVTRDSYHCGVGEFEKYIRRVVERIYILDDKNYDYGIDKKVFDEGLIETVKNLYVSAHRVIYFRKSTLLIEEFIRNLLSELDDKELEMLLWDNKEEYLLSIDSKIDNYLLKEKPIFRDFLLERKLPKAAIIITNKKMPVRTANKPIKHYVIPEIWERKWDIYTIKQIREEISEILNCKPEEIVIPFPPLNFKRFKFDSLKLYDPKSGSVENIELSQPEFTLNEYIGVGENKRREMYERSEEIIKILGRYL